jgi:hypothetical protein
MISLSVMMLHQYITKDKTITRWAVCFLSNKGQGGGIEKDDEYNEEWPVDYNGKH